MFACYSPLIVQNNGTNHQFVLCDVKLESAHIMASMFENEALHLVILILWKCEK